MEIEQYGTLLRRFNEVPTAERPPTFMEIEGYPQYENVCSNILAFYLDPGRQHGLGGLLLESLLKASGVALESSLEVATVEREVGTRKGKRIDLLVDTESSIILIENKIFAPTNNPFDNYSAFLDQQEYSGKEQHKILLTMYPSNAGREWGFKNVTYDALIDTVRASLGEYVIGADTRYLTHFLDFLNTIDHFGEGTRMDKQLIELFASNQDEVDKFLVTTWNLREEMRGKAKEVLEHLELEDEQVAYSGLWRSKQKLVDVAYVDVAFPEKFQIAVDCQIRPSGWNFHLFQRYPKKRNTSLLAHYLEKAGIFDAHTVEEGFTVYPEKLDYEEPIPDVAKFIENEFLDRLLQVSRDAHT